MSREEAIMQNILGASNVLEPSESNIEEILKSILYNTPYTKEAEFEIEKILLAIKNNGTYDGKGESRDMKILIAILNDLDYTEEAESRIEELFIEWLHQRPSIKVLEGVPPLTFTSCGLPLINYLIEGNTVQNGTPTPDNPIQPSECGERTGNLFDISKVTSNTVITNNGDGTLTASDYPANASENLGVLCPNLKEGDIVTLKFDTTSIANLVLIRYYVTAGLKWTENWYSGTSKTITAEWLNARIGFYKESGAQGGGKTTISNIRLNTGSTALPYEPYGYKIPISSANTTTPVYLGEVESTRQIKKWVLDGTETWNKGNYAPSGGYQFFTPKPSDIADNLDWLMTHFKKGSELNGSAFATYLSLYPEASILPENATANDFKEWLAAQYAAGTPVTVWYVLATEETAVVNEPLMRIGDYADTLSMEQAGVSIPTANGSTTLDVDTTLKPSNIYIEYK